MVVLVFGAACGRESAKRADQKNYEVVQEGSASGVTSTIPGPGETLGVTGTNADMTTAFSIDSMVAGSMPSTATAVGTLPSPAAYPSADSAYANPASTSSRTDPARTQPPADPAPQSAPRPDPSELQRDPRPTEPAMTETATAPPKAPDTVEPQQEEEEPAEEEKAPPPTSTDTRGQ